jgi:multiple sugar transport system ATP-binding protein
MELDVKPLRIDSMLVPAALEVRGLSKAFGAKTALNDIGFAVPEGSLTVLLGSAGAGKTTTLRLVAGLDRPDVGHVAMRGRDVTALEPKDRDIAMIFDNLALYPDKTGFANIASPLVIRGTAKAEMQQRVAQIASTLRIAHVLNRLPKTMSGGERQRVALGRALIRKPGLFLLDEPLSSLDAMLRIELRAELKRLQRDIGATFLLATPDFAEAMAVADTVVMLRDGRIVQVATAQSLYDDPVDREVARFVGSPEINLLKAVFEPAVKGTIRIAGASIAGLTSLQNVLPKAGGPFEIGIRPEQLRLLSPEEAPIRARVFDTEPLGLKSMMTVQNEEAEFRLMIDAQAARQYVAGASVGLDLIDSGLLAFDAVSGVRIG